MTMNDNATTVKGKAEKRDYIALRVIFDSSSSNPNSISQTASTIRVSLLYSLYFMMNNICRVVSRKRRECEVNNRTNACQSVGPNPNDTF